MKQTLVTAPGKVVVSGEYAVLAGAPAIVMAVDRRAAVRIVAMEGDFHSVTTPGYVDGTWRFKHSAIGEVEWQDVLPTPGLNLVEEALLRVVPAASPALSITVDTRGFSDSLSGQKLGLGSSAAAMTALIAALHDVCDHNNAVGLLARQAHLALQGGIGSGADIAASYHGGVIAYRVNENADSVHLAWPDDLFYRVLWSGQPARTTARISKLETCVANDKHWLPLIQSANDVVAAWSGGQAAEILSALRAYTASLKQFNAIHQLGIFDAGHDLLCDLARASPVVYKPCGAGGGDIGVVFGTRESALADFCTKAIRHGFSELPLKLDDAGVRVAIEEQL